MSTRVLQAHSIINGILRIQIMHKTIVSTEQPTIVRMKYLERMEEAKKRDHNKLGLRRRPQQ